MTLTCILWCDARVPGPLWTMDAAPGVREVVFTPGLAIINRPRHAVGISRHHVSGDAIAAHLACRPGQNNRSSKPVKRRC